MTKWKYLKGSEKDFEGAPNEAMILTIDNMRRLHYGDLFPSPGAKYWSSLGGRGEWGNGVTELTFNIIAQREPITECTFQDGVVFDAPISMSLNEFKCRQQSLNESDSDAHINDIPLNKITAADVEVVKYDPTKVDGEQRVKCGELKIDGKMHDATINKYHRDCKGVQVDVYDVLQAFNVTNPALQHLIKKALCVGIRGHKTKQQDLQDIIESAIRAKELENNK